MDIDVIDDPLRLITCLTNANNVIFDYFGISFQDNVETTLCVDDVMCLILIQAKNEFTIRCNQEPFKVLVDETVKTSHQALN